MSKSCVDFLAWSNTTETSGHDEAKCWLHFPIWFNLVGECGHTKVTKANKTRKVPWHWDAIHQQAFDNVKATITKDVTLAYPDYTQGFEVYTDSSKLQLGAIITQANRLLAFFSQNCAQHKKNTA